MAPGLLLARLPITKLLFLGVRQAARPVAKVAMAGAERSPMFQEACARAAQFVQSDRITMPRQQAVQAGCTLLGESVVFAVSSIVLVYEYHKAKEAEARKKGEERQAVRDEAAAGTREVQVQVQALEAHLRSQAAELQALRQEVSSAAQRGAERHDSPGPTAAAAKKGWLR
mmetsp:Transcript_84018/g.213873  ORF Transcript_84018/g.213873 Transcript_84018/m.213873 type:complete len:171 (-) Transcript_84018:4-516(-)